MSSRKRLVTTTDQDILLDDNTPTPYTIGFDQCDSAEKILSWVCHLCEKTRVTPTHIDMFVTLAAEHHNIQIHE